MVEERVDVSIRICDGFGAEIDDEGDVDQTGESINPRLLLSIIKIHYKIGGASQRPNQAEEGMELIPKAICFRVFIDFSQTCS